MNKKYIVMLVWTAFILLNTIILKNVVIRKSNINNYFRLHVVANSNNLKDQAIKMEVAKDINKKINEIIKDINCNSKSEIKKVIQNNTKDILIAANTSLKKQGDNKTVLIKIGDIYYDEKTKDNISMKEGVYDSIQVVIGEGKGKNFWSLIYPYSYAGMYELDTNDINNRSYITTDNESNTILSTNDIISDDNVQYKSGILEFAKKMWFN